MNRFVAGSAMPRNLLFCLLLLSLAAAPVPASDEDDRAGRVRAELDEVQADIEQHRRNMKTVAARHEAAQHKLKTAELEINRLRKDIRGLQAGLREREQVIRRLAGEQTQLERQRRVQQQWIFREMRAEQRLGRAGPLKVLLNQEDYRLLSRILAYYRSINRARIGQIRSYTLTIRQLDELQATEERARAEQRREETRLTARRDSLQQQQGERRQVVAALGVLLEDKKLRLQNLQQNERRLNELLQSIPGPARPSDDRPFRAFKGKLQLPVRGGITARYGSRRIASGVRWRGVFIAAPEGTPVHAVHQGEVVFADWLRGFGLLLIVNHGDGYMSLYGYNRAIYREPGDRIATGEVIAEAGSSGGQSQTGSYFEIRHNGRPNNPEAWCRARV